MHTRARANVITWAMIALLVSLITILIATPIGAAGPKTFAVNLKTDVADVAVGDGVCDTDAGTTGEQCTLRAAIQESNANAGVHDTIDFVIGTSQLPLEQRISITSALPEITDPVDILGPNWNGAAIVLDGGGGSYDGLDISAGSSEVRKLTIQDFGGDGIYLHGAGGNLIAGNRIGPFGLAALPSERNDLHGIQISGGVGNVIGGDTAADRNIISGNGRDGINIEDAGTNLVIGNYIGTNSAGTAAMGNGWSGVSIKDSTACTIGGVSGGRRNIISGNLSHGISISGGSSNGNQVRGNYIGTDISGTIVISNTQNGITIFGAQHTTIGGPVSTSRNIISGNGGSGVKIQDKSSAPAAVAHDNRVQGNYIGTDVNGTVALGNGSGVYISGGYSHTIGGTASGEGNVISGNLGHGVMISNESVDDIAVQGNNIGVDFSGSTALGNGADGIHIERSPSNLIGGTESGAGNVISDNAGDGIEIAFGTAAGNTIQGNYIGTDRSSDSALGNGGHGINLTNNAGSNTIGGLLSGADNAIAFNSGDGVSPCFACLGTNIRGNAIWGNSGLGIDYGNNGPGLGGPQLDVVNSNSGTPKLWGVVWGTAGQTYNLDVYASSRCDPSGYGEGQFYLTSDSVIMSGNGSATFGISLGDLSGYGCLSATATAPDSTTSEFSNGLSLLYKVFLPMIIR